MGPSWHFLKGTRCCVPRRATLSTIGVRMGGFCSRLSCWMQPIGSHAGVQFAKRETESWSEVEMAGHWGRVVTEFLKYDWSLWNIFNSLCRIFPSTKTWDLKYTYFHDIFGTQRKVNQNRKRDCVSLIDTWVDLSVHLKRQQFQVFWLPVHAQFQIKSHLIIFSASSAARTDAMKSLWAGGEFVCLQELKCIFMWVTAFTFHLIRMFRMDIASPSNHSGVSWCHQPDNSLPLINVTQIQCFHLQSFKYD